MIYKEDNFRALVLIGANKIIREVSKHGAWNICFKSQREGVGSRRFFWGGSRINQGVRVGYSGNRLPSPDHLFDWLCFLGEKWLYG